VGFHEFGHDLVLADELGFELLDFMVLGVFDGFGLRSRATISYRMLSAPWANFIVPLAVELVSNDSAFI